MYNSLNEGDPKKTYQTLRDMIRRHIERQTEYKMLLEKEKAVKDIANIFQSLKPSRPAPKAKATPAPSDPKKPKTKPSSAVGKTEEATPVKPTPNPKRHPEDKKGKGKGDGKDRGRSTSIDKKKITSKFFAKGKIFLCLRSLCRSVRVSSPQPLLGDFALGARATLTTIAAVEGPLPRRTRCTLPSRKAHS